MEKELSLDITRVLLAYVHDPVVILDEQGQTCCASDRFLSLEEESGTPFFNAWVRQDTEDMPIDVYSFLRQSNINTTTMQGISISWNGRSFLLSGISGLSSEEGGGFSVLKLSEVGQEEQQHENGEQMEVTIRAQKEELQVLEEAIRHRTSELEQANEELRQANRDLTSFTNITNHDLQEPLRKIRNFVNRIQEDHANRHSDATRLHFARIQAATKRMQRLLEDVLRYARIRDKERLFKKSDLTALVKEVLYDFRHVIEVKKAALDIQSLGTVEVVPDQFKELIRQLVSNALKFHKPDQGPRLSIKSRYLLPESEFLSGVKYKQEYLNLIFEDTGIGIEEEYHEKIFEVFQRLHPAGVYDGTGIGLPICKRIVENHRGFITASGKKNAGMRVDVYLPVRQFGRFGKQAD